MKLFGVFFVTLFCSLMIIVALDLLIGESLTQSLNHFIDPFKVMHAGEYVVLAGFIIIVIVQQIVMIRKEKKGSS
ncbi:hypothetical protein [Niallia sp. 01092]|uniref:hypothetical protein n=1 Tax=unclassified Niallia TaxID=2837522 RepID=UPI003FCFECAB